VLGGTRSGKSRFSEQLALKMSNKRVYLATSEAFDEEMVRRIEKHKKDREKLNFHTIEEPIDLATTLKKIEQEGQVVVVECISTWIGNLLHYEGIKDDYKQVKDFLDYLKTAKQKIIIVSNEVGQSLVPIEAISRHFVDLVGFLNQDIAKIASTVVWVVAGLPRYLKGKR
jgi:adenosylcobinamide kinase/adenosylcobinamide-phosphate guanylyltransferase